jgi:hypothetical protein
MTKTAKQGQAMKQGPARRFFSTKRKEGADVGTENSFDYKTDGAGLSVSGIRNQNTCETWRFSRHSGREPLLYQPGNF